MRSKVDIVASIQQKQQLKLLQDCPYDIDLMEIRADLIPKIGFSESAFPVPAVYVLKSKTFGGNFEGSLAERHQLLKAASKHFDYIELEASSDLDKALLQEIPMKKRRIAWYGTQGDSSRLNSLLETYIKIPAHRYKIVLEHVENKELCLLLNLLNSYQDRVPLAVYGVGSGTEWSQVLAPFLGSCEVPCSFSSNHLNSPYFTPKQLQEDYGFPHTYSIKQLFGIVGNPVLGSISPKLHNEAYRNMKLPCLYLPFQVEDFLSFKKDLMDSPSVLPIPLNGLTVVAPYKELGYSASKYKEIAPNAYAKACNGMVRSSSDWRGFSTDAHGAIEALEQSLDSWTDKAIAILGCGGAGRSIATALKRKNKNITLVNRTEGTGATIAKSLALPFVALKNFSPNNFHIIIHATPLGKKRGEIPFNLSQLNPKSIVIDHVYSANGNTPLVQYCHLHKIKVVDGKEIARLQIAQQFKHMTEQDMLFNENITRNLKIN